MPYDLQLLTLPTPLLCRKLCSRLRETIPLFKTYTPAYTKSQVSKSVKLLPPSWGQGVVCFWTCDAEAMGIYLSRQFENCSLVQAKRYVFGKHKKDILKT